MSQYLTVLGNQLVQCSWWRHQMDTSSALLALYAGNSPVTGEFPSQRPVTRSFDVSLDLRLYKWLIKQSWGWWFETPSCPLWRHWNVVIKSDQVSLHSSDHLCPPDDVKNSKCPAQDFEESLDTSRFQSHMPYSKFIGTLVICPIKLVTIPLLRTLFNFNPSIDK